MTIFRGGGGSTNITYVAIRAAAQTPMIQTQAATARLRRLRGLAGGTTGRDEESTIRSPECRWIQDRTPGRWRGASHRDAGSSGGIIHEAGPVLVRTSRHLSPRIRRRKPT